MKTLSKSPYGIYLLEKGEEYVQFVATSGVVDEFGVYQICLDSGKLIVLDLLTVADILALCDNDTELLEKITANGDVKADFYNHINHLLRQKNLPELREGERPKPVHYTPEYRAKWNKEHPESMFSEWLNDAIQKWYNATDPKDILIEVP